VSFRDGVASLRIAGGSEQAESEVAPVTQADRATYGFAETQRKGEADVRRRRWSKSATTLEVALTPSRIAVVRTEHSRVLQRWKSSRREFRDDLPGERIAPRFLQESRRHKRCD